MYIYLAAVQAPGQDPHCATLYPQSYVRRGLYVYQLEWWLRHFPPEQFLILNHEQVSGPIILTIGGCGGGRAHQGYANLGLFPLIDMDLLVGVL